MATSSSNILDINIQQPTSTTKIGNQALSSGIGMATDYLSSTLGSNMFGDSYVGSAVGQAFSNTLASTGNTISNNLLKGNSLTQGLGSNIGSSLAGVAVGVAGDLIGKGVTSLLGDSKLSKGVGAGLSSGISSVGGAMAGNLINGANLMSGINPVGLGASAIGAGLSAAFGPSKEYGGKHGNITLIADTAYDLVQAGVGAIPVYGLLIAGGMALNKGLSNIFGSTDGMCVCAGTKVYTALGKLVNIEDLKLEDGIIGWNQVTRKIRPNTIKGFIEPIKKECLRIKLENGIKLECSIDHPILSHIEKNTEIRESNSYKYWQFRRADELKIGNWVGLANNVDYWGEKELSDAYLVGRFTGEGVFTSLPKNIQDFNRNSICNLIAGLYDIAGSTNEKLSVILYQSNLKLLNSIRDLLYKLGIYSSINKTDRNSNEGFILEINDSKSIINFYEFIPLEYKKETLLKVYNIVKDKSYKDSSDLFGAKQVKIVSIEKIGVQTVYNLEAAEDHTYLANNIITHNTTQDAILGSAWAGPLKWVNMWGSSKTSNFNNQSWQNTEKTNNFMGSSFGNLADKFKKAREEAGKVYGTFSLGAKREAEENIQYANRAWNKVLAMADKNEYQNIRSNDMSSINNLRYAQNILGGFTPLLVGKMGMKIFNNSIDHNRGMRYLSAAALIDNKQMILSCWNGGYISAIKRTANYDPDETIFTSPENINVIKTDARQSKDWINWWLMNREDVLALNMKSTKEEAKKERWRQVARIKPDLVQIKNTKDVNGEDIGAYTNPVTKQVTFKPFVQIYKGLITHEQTHSMGDDKYLNAQIKKIKELLPKFSYTHPNDKKPNNYWNDPIEIYGRLMQFRRDNKINPKHKFTLDEIKSWYFENNGNLYGNGKMNDSSNMLRLYSPETMYRLLNEIAQNPTLPSNSNNLDNKQMILSAGNGVKIPKFKTPAGPIEKSDNTRVLKPMVVLPIKRKLKPGEFFYTDRRTGKIYVGQTKLLNYHKTTVQKNKGIVIRNMHSKKESKLN